MIYISSSALPVHSIKYLSSVYNFNYIHLSHHQQLLPSVLKGGDLSCSVLVSILTFCIMDLMFYLFCFLPKTTALDIHIFDLWRPVKRQYNWWWWTTYLLVFYVYWGMRWFITATKLKRQKSSKSHRAAIIQPGMSSHDDDDWMFVAIVWFSNVFPFIFFSITLP